MRDEQQDPEAEKPDRKPHVEAPDGDDEEMPDVDDEEMPDGDDDGTPDGDDDEMPDGDRMPAGDDFYP